MTVAEAEKAFREMLPVETIQTDFHSGKIRKYDMPVELVYKGPGALLTKVFLVVEEGDRCIIRYPIEKLKLSEVKKEVI